MKVLVEKTCGLLSCLVPPLVILSLINKSLEGNSNSYLRKVYRFIIWNLCTIPSSMYWYDNVIINYPGCGMSRDLFIKREYEPVEFSLLESKVKEDWICIDVGANFGLFTLFLKDRTSKVVAIEPSSREFVRLQANISLNKQENVELLKMVCSSSNDKSMDLLIAEDRFSGQNAIDNFYYSGVKQVGIESVSTVTIDSITNDYDRLDLIKIDTDGHELEVLRGAVETLRLFRPLLLIELPTEKVIEFLEEHDYRLERDTRMENCFAFPI